MSAPCVQDTVSDSYAKLYRSGSLWVDEFQMIELDEIMRQCGDSEFCELLCRIRTADHTDDDLATLKSREVTSDMPNLITPSMCIDSILMLMTVIASC